MSLRDIVLGRHLNAFQLQETDVFCEICRNDFTTVVFLMSLAIPCHGAQTVTALKVDNPPVIDGKADDPAWKKGEYVVTHDKVANIDIMLKAVYTPEKIFFLTSSRSRRIPVA